MFYLTTHSTHFIYGYMASDIWLRTILIVRKETRCRHIGYSYRLTARVLLYAPSHRQDNTYHGLCYTSRGALAGTRNSSMKDRSDDPSHHERTLYLWATSRSPYLVRQDNTIYIFSIKFNFSSIGQNKSKLQKQIRKLLILTEMVVWLNSIKKIQLSNFLICFCSFELSCPTL